ncbi:MAG TPA: dephospho-CoA kinase [Candidatus Dormibacteraeota bacterium]|nr:dephospho-CoA kinase [Candidatus Dormibacteraeota bacterium]
MLRVGLTGGIGSGKSTVVAMLRQRGLAVSEADDIARDLVRRGQPAYDEILQTFGAQILQENGEIDRKRLAAIVFGSSERLDRLNRIVHPRVRERTERWLAEREKEGARVAIVEAPLLVEAGSHRRLDRLVVVWCRPEQQLARLAERGMSREDAERRIAAQMDVEKKKALADDLIDNSGTVEQTRQRVDRLVRKLESEKA